MKKTYIQIFLAAVFFLSHSIPFALAADKQISIVAVLGLTGAAAAHGSAIRDGMDLAQNELQQNGWKVEINYQDDQTDSKKTVSAIQSALSLGNRFFIGPTWSFQVNAARGLYARSDVVAIVPAGTSDTNGGSISGVFNLTPTVSRVVSPLSKWLAQSSYKSPCLFTPNGDWGERHKEVFLGAIQNVKLNAAATENFNYGIDRSAVKSVLLKMKSKNCDSLFITGGASDIAVIIAARNDLNLNLDIISSDGAIDALQTGLITTKDLNENVFVISLPIKEEFAQKFKAKYKREPNAFASRGYDSIYIFAKALESTDRSSAAVKAYLSGDFRMSGASGEIRFDSAGDVVEGDYLIVPLR